MAGLEDQAKKRVETFSGGMKRRINIAAGILHKPRVLLMDEPTVGHRPAEPQPHPRDGQASSTREGMTVLYTSHYMEEVEALCDRIAIVDHGKLIALGTMDELRAMVGDRTTSSRSAWRASRPMPRWTPRSRGSARRRGVERADRRDGGWRSSRPMAAPHSPAWWPSSTVRACA